MNNKKATTTSISIYTCLMQYLSIAYIAYLMIAFVLGYHEHFFDIAQTKRALFIYGTISYLIPMSFLYFLDFLHTSKRKYKVDILLCCFIGLIVSWIVGIIWNIDFIDSFWGASEKCTGLLLYLVAAFAILFLRKYFCWNGTLSWIYLFSCLSVYCLQILNRFSIDPLLMYENLVARQIPAFLSTLGHMNYNASFNCIMLSINLCFFINARQRLSQVLYGVCLFLGYAGSICCNSDSVFLGIALSFLLCIGYCFSHKNAWPMLWNAAFIFFASSLSIFILYAVFPSHIQLPGEVTFALLPSVLCFEATFLILGLVFIQYVLERIRIPVITLVFGNHTELRFFNQKKGSFKDENTGMFIREIIKAKLDGNPQFEMEINPSGLIFDEVQGYNILGIHGEVKNMAQALKDFSLTYDVNIDVLIGGHKHHLSEETVGVDKETVIVPSIIGIDDFAISLNKTSRPGASFLIVEKGKGIVTEHRIKL